MNVIVLSFDRLPSRLLGCYGNALIETPGFDRLASESIVFDEHYAEDLRTDAASHAWWTGCYHFPRDAKLATGDVGVIGYLIPQPTYDTYGLNDEAYVHRFGRDRQTYLRHLFASNRPEALVVVSRRPDVFHRRYSSDAWPCARAVAAERHRRLGAGFSRD